MGTELTEEIQKWKIMVETLQRQSLDGYSLARVTQAYLAICDSVFPDETRKAWMRELMEAGCKRIIDGAEGRQ